VFIGRRMLAAVRPRDSGRTGCPAWDASLIFWRSVRASEPRSSTRRVTLLRCTGCGTAVTAGASEPELHDSGA